MVYAMVVQGPPLALAAANSAPSIPSSMACSIAVLSMSRSRFAVALAIIAAVSSIIFSRSARIRASRRVSFSGTPSCEEFVEWYCRHDPGIDSTLHQTL